MIKKLVIPGKLAGLNEYINECRRNPYAGAKIKSREEDYIKMYVRQQLKGVRFPGKVRVSFHWYEPNRKRDLDNICAAKKFIFDALVDMAVIVADGWRGVIGFTDNFYVDKENPRIEVWIESEGENGKSESYPGAE